MEGYLAQCAEYKFACMAGDYTKSHVSFLTHIVRVCDFKCL
jgi:hypothetical protein